MLRTVDHELALKNLTKGCGHRFNVERDRWARGAEVAENKSAMICNANTGKLDICGFMFITWQDADITKLAGFRYPSQYVQMYLGKKDRCMEPMHWLTTSSQSDSDEALNLIRLNDAPEMDDLERELAITSMLANEWGIGVQWMDSTGIPWVAPRLTGVTDYNAYFRKIEEDNRRRRIEARNRERASIQAARHTLEQELVAGSPTRVRVPLPRFSDLDLHAVFTGRTDDEVPVRITDRGDVVPLTTER